MSGVDAAEASLPKHVLAPGGCVPPQNKRGAMHSGGTPELCNVFGALNLCNNTPIPAADDPFVCPLTHEVMVDPIVANDGFSYERVAFDAWLAEGKRTSPKTGLYLLVTSVLPNFALKRAIDMYYGRGREQASNGSTGSRGSGRGAVEQENEEEQGGSGRELDDSRGTPLSRTAVELAEDTLRESPCPQGQPNVWAQKAAMRQTPFQFSASAFPRSTSSPAPPAVLPMGRQPTSSASSVSSTSPPLDRASLLPMIEGLQDNMSLTPGHALLLAAGASSDDSNDTCAALVALLRLQLADRTFVHTILLALGRLTYAKGEGPHAVHRRRLGALGACEVTVEVLKRYLISAETTEAAVVLLCQLAREDSHRSPQEAEMACDVVVNVMRAFPRDAGILRAACGCVWNLSATNTFNTRRLGYAGGCEEVLAAMQAFQNDVDLYRTGCGAVLNLAMDADNSRRLGEGGACELVLSIMRMFPNDPVVADNGCAALCNLSCQNEDNKRRLRAGGAVGLLQAVRNGWAREAAIQRSSAQALVNLQQTPPNVPPTI